uniref:Uncharacterized protein n=1 Tax=Anguilla anguilla TaxID=7936 RepID=A0A0E9WNF7_ANGAN
MEQFHGQQFSEWVGGLKKTAFDLLLYFIGWGVPRFTIKMGGSGLSHIVYEQMYCRRYNDSLSLKSVIQKFRLDII